MVHTTRETFPEGYNVTYNLYKEETLLAVLDIDTNYMLRDLNIINYTEFDNLPNDTKTLFKDTPHKLLKEI